MADVNADVWVLTETHVDHRPSPAHRHGVFSPPHPERRPDHERWTAIWSRWPLTPLNDPPPHRRGTVAAMVRAPSGPLIVYGTVIAWANEPHHDDGRPARMWEVHLAEIERQGREWAQLRAEHPGVPLVVAGDFNQDRDGSNWYGTVATRARLGEALAGAGLVCTTRIDAVACGLLERNHLIDHICLPPELDAAAEVRCWEPVDGDQRLSDHPVVAVDLPLNGHS
jgi:endonuclease/exonuclease/phosphatase family metal-dependent hydrolase